jgi:O-acetyl-ADP-ribose deacetylase (regulator of RNase III)
MFRWVRRALLGFALVVLVGGGVLALTARSDLKSARATVNSRWQALRPALETRYALLAAANTATGAAGGPERDIVRSIDTALTDWQRDKTASVPTQIDDANALEALGRRLTTTVTASARLKALPAVMTAATNFGKATVPESARTFNRAVRDFEDARGGSVRRPIANLLGYDSIASFDLPLTVTPT